MTTELRCKNCGFDNLEGSRFCASCGKALGGGKAFGEGAAPYHEEGHEEDGHEESGHGGVAPGPGTGQAVASLSPMPVPTLVLYTLLSFGIYSAVWFLKRLEAFNSLKSEVKLNQGVFGFIIAGFVANIFIVLYLVFTGEGGTAPGELEGLSLSLVATSDMLSIAVQVAVLIQAFKVRRILVDHFEAHLKRDLGVSWGWTLVFGVFYLQYKINRLQEV